MCGAETSRGARRECARPEAAAPCARAGARGGPLLFAACLALAFVSLVPLQGARAGEAPRGGEPKAPAPDRQMRLQRSKEMNVVDESLLALAEFYLGEGRDEDAVKVLERMAKDSLDSEARSMGHYNLGLIYERRMKDPERARKEYARVTGVFAAAARNRIVGPLRREGKWDELVALLRESAGAAEEPEDKAEVLRVMINIARSSGRKDLVESTLLSVPELITHEEAQKAAEVRRKKIEEMRKKAEQSRPGGAPPRAGARRPWQPGTPFAGRGGRAPSRLERTGRAAEPGVPAAPVERPGEGVRGRTPRQPARPPDGEAGPARPAAAGRGPAKRTVAELRAQIRALERAGFDEEAKKLRRELDELLKETGEDRTDHF